MQMRMIRNNIYNENGSDLIHVNSRCEPIETGDRGRYQIVTENIVSAGAGQSTQVRKNLKLPAHFSWTGTTSTGNFDLRMMPAE